MTDNKFNKFFDVDKMSPIEVMHMYYSLLDKVKLSERKDLSDAYHRAWAVTNKRMIRDINVMA